MIGSMENGSSRPIAINLCKLVWIEDHHLFSRLAEEHEERHEQFIAVAAPLCFNGYDSENRAKKDSRNTLGFSVTTAFSDRYDVRDYANINFVLTGYLPYQA